MSFPYVGESIELNEITRQQADGAFVRLPAGVTHYELGGPAAAQTVVLVHGFSVPYFIFDPTFIALQQAGYRVLRYDLFGRGWSDRPLARYDLSFFVAQLSQLLNALNLRQPVGLVGLSMGGPITAAFIESEPGRVASHVLIDPAGAAAIRLPAGLRLALLPGVGELLLGMFGREKIVVRLMSGRADPGLIANLRRRYLVQARFKGFKRALLSTVRSGMLGPSLEIYRRAGQMRKPTLLIWGRQDRLVPVEHSLSLRAAIPHAALHVVENSGHVPHYEQPAAVNPVLIRFLGMHPN